MFEKDRAGRDPLPRIMQGLTKDILARLTASDSLSRKAPKGHATVDGSKKVTFPCDTVATFADLTKYRDASTTHTLQDFLAVHKIFGAAAAERVQRGYNFVAPRVRPSGSSQFCLALAQNGSHTLAYQNIIGPPTIAPIHNSLCDFDPVTLSYKPKNKIAGCLTFKSVFIGDNDCVVRLRWNSELEAAFPNCREVLSNWFYFSE